MPNYGERVLVRPRHGLQVQRGDGLYQQYIAQEGQEVTWDAFLEARYHEGSIEVVVPMAAPEGSEAAPASEVH